LVLIKKFISKENFVLRHLLKFIAIFEKARKIKEELKGRRKGREREKKKVYEFFSFWILLKEEKVFFFFILF
jgi:hypothetical protein